MGLVPDWIVTRISVAQGAQASHAYRLHVQGFNLAQHLPDARRAILSKDLAAVAAAGVGFSWSLHDVADPRFDLSRATIDDAARPFLGRPDATLVSHAFDAGNFAAAYVSTDDDLAWDTYKRETHFAGDAYRPAFMLGFFASFEEHEIPADRLDDYRDARASPVGQACLAAGYVD